jgi:acetolactate synthase small subunit
MSTGELLRLRVRHELGALTRIASILNPFPVTELHYTADDGGLARAIVRLEADPDVVTRVLLRLERVVQVLDVTRQSEAEAVALGTSTRQPAAASAAAAAETAEDFGPDLASICV